MRAAISPATAAIMIEGIQGEGGVTRPRRSICWDPEAVRRKEVIAFYGRVQCGHFRTGRFQGFQRILEDKARASFVKGRRFSPNAFLPDVSRWPSRSGAVFPIGAFWARAPYADILGAGSHGTTYGGSPLACRVALKVLEVIQREKLADNARKMAISLSRAWKSGEKYPNVIKMCADWD